MKREEKCKKRADYVLGYTKPVLTKEELELKRQLESYESWTPTTKSYNLAEIELFGFVEDRDFYLKPQPEKPILSANLIEKIRLRNEWVKYFNHYYCNL